MNFRTTLATTVSKASSTILRYLGHGGTNLPGRLAKKIDPNILAKLSRGLRIIIVTGTNGKTTTTKMIAKMLEDSKVSFFTNKSGANLQTGIISAFAEAANFNGKSKYTHALIECDEAVFRQISRMIKVDTVVVTNIFEDQLDRFGEISYIKNVIKTAIENQPKATLCLNANNPNVVSLVSDKNPNQIIWFGDQDALKTPDITLKKITDTTIDKSEFQIANHNIESLSIELNLPGKYNINNALAALAAAEALDIEIETAKESLKNVSASFGRAEKLLLKNTPLHFFLVKNPAGATEVLKLISAHPEKSKLVIALNDRIADGTDMSWIWDVDFEGFQKTNSKYFEKIYLAGIRSAELALRLEYAGFDMKKIVVMDNYNKILDEISKTPTNTHILHTYTAMFEIRHALAEKINLKDFYE